MNIEIKVDGHTVVNMRVSANALSRMLSGGLVEVGVPKSTPITVAQAKDVLSRIDVKSAQFLRHIATHNGECTWADMQKIFEIDDDWKEFSAHYGKGITRTLRHILDDKAARLVWWNDSEWPEYAFSGDWDDCRVFVDGPALDSLRAATNVR